MTKVVQLVMLLLPLSQKKKKKLSLPHAVVYTPECGSLNQEDLTHRGQRCLMENGDNQVNEIIRGARPSFPIWLH